MGEGARREGDWSGQRSQFGLLDRCVYFNACSLGPLPRRGREAIEECLRLWDEAGTPVWHRSWMPTLAVLRARFGRLICASGEAIALAPSVSVALSVVAAAMLASTDRRRVLIGDLDFPTLAYPFLSRPDVEVEFVRSEDGVTIPPEAFVDRIDDRVAVVATTHLFYTTGYLQDVRPIAEAARAAGAMTLIDGYQTVGCVPVDVSQLDCDVFVAGALKWLSGGPGTAFTWCRPDVLPALQPAGVTGWFGSREPLAFDLEHLEFAPNGRRFETGTWPMPSHAAALAGVDLVLGVGVDRIAARLREITTYLLERCRAAGLPTLTPPEPERRCGIVSLRCEDPDAVERDLAAAGVIVDARPGILRLSPHWALTDTEVCRGMDAVEACMASRAGSGR
jgi:selenocysteine lyase/cysteine desulfurase